MALQRTKVGFQRLLALGDEAREVGTKVAVREASEVPLTAARRAPGEDRQRGDLNSVKVATIGASRGGRFAPRRSSTLAFMETNNGSGPAGADFFGRGTRGRL